MQVCTTIKFNKKKLFCKHNLHLIASSAFYTNKLVKSFSHSTGRTQGNHSHRTSDLISTVSRFVWHPVICALRKKRSVFSALAAIEKRSRKNAINLNRKSCTVGSRNVTMFSVFVECLVTFGIIYAGAVERWNSSRAICCWVMVNWCYHCARNWIFIYCVFVALLFQVAMNEHIALIEGSSTCAQQKVTNTNDIFVWVTT